LTNQAGESLGQIVESALDVGQVVTQIATAAEEQSTAGEEIAKNIEGIATAAREATIAIAEAARSSEELSSMAARLAEVVARFKS